MEWSDLKACPVCDLNFHRDNPLEHVYSFHDWWEFGSGGEVTNCPICGHMSAACLDRDMRHLMEKHTVEEFVASVVLHCLGRT